MTCVVAIKYQNEDNKNKIIFGADSAISSYRKVSEASKVNKIIKKEDVLIGVTGALRFLNLIEHEFCINLNCFGFNSNNLEGYIVKHFVCDLKNFLTTQEFFDKEKHKMREGYEFKLIVACYDHLYQIESDFSVIEIDKYVSIGSGSDFAMGYLYSKKNENINNEEMAKVFIEEAIKCAAYYDFFVNDKIQFNSI